MDERSWEGDSFVPSVSLDSPVSSLPSISLVGEYTKSRQIASKDEPKKINLDTPDSNVAAISCTSFQSVSSQGSVSPDAVNIDNFEESGDEESQTKIKYKIDQSDHDEVTELKAKHQKNPECASPSAGGRSFQIPNRYKPQGPSSHVLKAICLMRIAKYIGDKQLQFGIELGLCHEEVKTIQLQEHIIMNQGYEILRMWKIKQGNDATFGNLRPHLLQCDLDVIKIEEEISQL